jgi:hypothetical protein
MASQTSSAALTLGGIVQDPSVPGISARALTLEYAAQQQPLHGLQTDAPTEEAVSREPSTVERLLPFSSALESLSKGCELAENSTKSLPMAEDPPRFLVAEGISNGIPNVELSNHICS